MVACDFCACTPDGPALVGALFCLFKLIGVNLTESVPVFVVSVFNFDVR